MYTMNTLWGILPLFAFGLNLILALLVLRQRPHNRLHQIFALFLLSMGLWASNTFNMRLSPTLAATLFWEKATFAILPFAAVFFYHFVLLFTRTRGTARQLPLAYLSIIIFASLAPTNLLVAGMREMWYGHGFVPGPLLPLYMSIFYGFVIIALILLVKAYRTSVSTLEKNRYLYVAIGASIILLGLLIDVFAASGVHIYSMGIPSNIIFSALCAYAILKYHLFDISVLVRKGTAYVLVSIFGLAIYIGLLITTYNFMARAGGFPVWLHALFILIIAVGLQPAVRRAQNLVDRWFYRGRYDYLSALESLGAETKAITDLAFIAGSLVNTVTSAMRCKNASVLLPDAEDKYFVSVAQRGTGKYSALRLRKDSALVWQLNQQEDFLTRQDINIMPQLQALTAREREILNNLAAELFIPLLTREGLRGILILGQKLSGQDYSPEETSVLRVVARQMATILDNARLYDLQIRKYQEQALLARLGMIVSAELDLTRICRLFIKELKKTLPIDYVSINLTGEKGKPLPTAGSSTTSRNLHSVWENSENLLSLAMTSIPTSADLELHYGPDLLHNGKSLAEKRFHKAGIRSVLRFPLQSKSESLGEVVFSSRKPDAYGEDNQRLLQQVATQLAIAIDKSRLYDLERKARLALEKQYGERTEFINSLIHEVKTPLTAMLASSELLREELANDSSTLGALAENLDVATHNLDRRISELVNFVKLQSTETRLKVRSVDIHQIFERASSHVTGLLRSKHQTLNIELPPSLGHVKADPERLLQILLNLLTNASKFSGSHQAIYLRAYPADNSLIVELRDSAPPIKPQEAELIFSPYQQIRRTESGGLGLGLSICKKLVQLHRGKLWVETDDTGNRFKFSLPLANKVQVKE